MGARELPERPPEADTHEAIAETWDKIVGSHACGDHEGVQIYWSFMEHQIETLPDRRQELQDQIIRNYEAWLAENPPNPLHDENRPRRGRPAKNSPYGRRYSLAETRTMLAVIPAEKPDVGRFGVALGRAFYRSEEAFEAYKEWAARCEEPVEEAQLRRAYYDISQSAPADQYKFNTLITAALAYGWAPSFGAVPKEEFVFLAPMNAYWYRPTGEFWLAAAVNSVVSPVNESENIVPAAEWIQAHAPATSSTEDPALEGDFLRGVNYSHGECVPSEGAAVLNTYRPARIESGDAAAAEPYVEHVRRVFPQPGDADRLLDYLAHVVQRPGVKIRFALLLAGEQGVGKDTAVEMATPAIGPWNCAAIDPTAFEGAFNEYASKVLIRISEAANLGDMSKWAFNERTKVLISGNPDQVKINEKYRGKFDARLHGGIIVTTNQEIGGLYVPPDDRRYDVLAAASREALGFTEDGAAEKYFTELWDWFYCRQGRNHVAALLRTRDLSHFSAGAGQRKTALWHEIVAHSMTNDEWVADALHRIGGDGEEWPSVVRAAELLTEVRYAAEGNNDRQFSIGAARKGLEPAMKRLGYRRWRNPRTADGRWSFKAETRLGERRALTTVYVRTAAKLSADEVVAWIKEKGGG